MNGLWYSAITALLTCLFAGMVLAQFVRRQALNLLVWFLGILAYAVGTLTQALLFLDFLPSLFHLWYWTGAMLVAAWLGQGTLLLLVGNRLVRSATLWFVIALSILSHMVVFGSNTNPEAYTVGIDLTIQYHDIFDVPTAHESLRSILAITLNSYGTLLLVGGAVLSGFRLWRTKQGSSQRLIGNSLIAVGGLLPALGGTLILFGDGTLKYIGQLLGAVFLFTGFLFASGSIASLMPARAQPMTAAPNPNESQSIQPAPPRSQHLPQNAHLPVKVFPIHRDVTASLTYQGRKRIWSADQIDVNKHPEAKSE